VSDLAYALQWAAGSTSLISAWYMGNRSLAGPIWGVVSQACWFGMIVTNGLWPLLPTMLIFMGIHIRNLHRWLRERHVMAESKDKGAVRVGNMVNQFIAKKPAATKDTGKVRLGNFRNPFVSIKQG
jgi:hypothetical protein